MSKKLDDKFDIDSVFDDDDDYGNYEDTDLGDEQEVNRKGSIYASADNRVPVRKTKKRKTAGTGSVYADHAARSSKNHSSRKKAQVQEGNSNAALQKKLSTYRKQLIAHRMFLFLILIVIALIVVIKLFDGRVKGTPLNTAVMVDEKLNFHVDESASGLPEEFPTMKALVEDNYLRYLNKAYVLIGTYPDCEYYKISANVARNEFNWSEDFYVNGGGLYYSYFKDGEDKGRVGIDVSEFQKEIEWDKVKAAGIKVAIIRVGYRGYGSGEIHADALVDTNLTGATEAGLDVGVYFFSSAINREEGIEEANYTLEKIKGYDIKQPVIIDTEYVFEDEAARANNLSVEDRTAAVVGFCETIEAAGYTPMVYASRDQFIKYLDIDAIGKWEFWLAAYDTPVFPYHTEGYQYSPYGYVDGIPTQVDLDVWMR